MRQAVLCLASALIAFSLSAHAEVTESDKNSQQKLAQDNTPFKPFTGKITRNRVRLRLQPTLEASILRELNHNDMLIVVGETNEFYIVKPPPDVKAYVFRTFILDNVVEGSHVNVRLDPDLEAPVIAQLNSGDHVQGTISPLNSKWMEIVPPESAKFYVCKDYVENIGAPSVLSVLTKRRDEVNSLLDDADEISQIELQKPYEAMKLDQAIANLNKVISQYSDFQDQVIRAKELLAQNQEAFLQKKLAYLESKTNNAVADNIRNASQQTYPVQAQDQTPAAPSASEKMSSWLPIEAAIYENWAQNHPGSSLEDFYAQQRNDALVLTGIVEPYIRSVRNKPGDFILISKTSRLPTAYLYSTMVNLQGMTGKEITIVAVPRSNNNYAFPAYFVISVE